MCEKSQSQSRGRVGLRESFDRVKEQLDFECFGKNEIGMVWELALIMAEVMSLPEELPVSISGEKLPAGLVKEVYEVLETDHIRFVMEKFRELTYEVKHRKAYLRTALYHAAFEMNSYYENS